MAYLRKHIFLEIELRSMMDEFELAGWRLYELRPTEGRYEERISFGMHVHDCLDLIRILSKMLDGQEWKHFRSNYATHFSHSFGVLIRFPPHALPCHQFKRVSSRVGNQDASVLKCCLVISSVIVYLPSSIETSVSEKFGNFASFFARRGCWV